MVLTLLMALESVMVVMVLRKVETLLGFLQLRAMDNRVHNCRCGLHTEGLLWVLGLI